MTFTCKVTGAKPAVDKYKFYFKNGNTPIAENSKRTYQINSVKGSDQGTYKCVPHNAVRDGEQATVMLTVNGKLWMKYDLYLKNKEKGSLLIVEQFTFLHKKRMLKTDGSCLVKCINDTLCYTCT